MNMNRRNFLKGTAWMGAAALAGGCMTDGFRLCGGGSMQGFSCAPIRKVRVGLIGLGSRGLAAALRLPKIPGVELVAVAEVRGARLDLAKKAFAEEKLPWPKHVYGNGDADGWKRMCERGDIDAIYSATPWQLHVATGLYAMECGEHVFIEVPAAMTLDDCWALVEKSEETHRHCMQLENCCYGEAEMLALNLCRQGVLGELVHGEGAYIHNLCIEDYMPEMLDQRHGCGYYDYWRLKWNVAHKGNQYPTHGLGPVCQYMNVNRGDRMDYLVSLESNQYNMEAYAGWKFPKSSWQADTKVEMGDMNTTLVKTVNGRSIMIQHDVSSPRPYSRINRISGTKGIFEGNYFKGDMNPVTGGCYCRYGWRETPDDRLHAFFDEKKAEEMRLKYRHPLWKQAGELAKAVGGHGGMDFLMDLRWVYCLQNGLPLDMDVYDLATWCSICELSERSVRSGSKPQDVPDFTRGGWKTAKPLGIEGIDMTKLDFDRSRIDNSSGQMNI